MHQSAQDYFVAPVFRERRVDNEPAPDEDHLVAVETQSLVRTACEDHSGGIAPGRLLRRARAIGRRI